MSSTQQSIAIIGLGQLGTCLGLALKQAKAADINIVGFDTARDTAVRAQKLGAVDKIVLRLPLAVERAELLFITTPVMIVKETLSHVAGMVSADCVLTDTASIKGRVMQWAEEILPPQVDFVGGHPVLRGTTANHPATEANAFQGCTYCLVPAHNATPRAVEKVVQLVKAIGAKPFFIDAIEHDALVAGMENIPFLLACALVSVTTRNVSWSELSQFATEPYRELHRIASIGLEANVDICLNNSAGILRWLEEYIEELCRYRGFLSGESKELRKVLTEGFKVGQRELRGGSKSSTISDMLGAGERLAALLAGERLVHKIRHLRRIMREQDK